MGKVLALAPFILGLIGLMAVACGGAASPTTGVTPGAQQTPDEAPAAGAFNANIQDFTQQDLTVQTGTTVVWTNRDDARHTTTAAAGQWDSGALRKGQSFKFTLTEAGVFSYFCSIHPYMTAEVTVNN